MLNSETVMEVMKSLLNRKTIVDVAIEQNLSVEEVKKCLDQLNDINGSTYHPELYISICEIQQELANEKLEEKRNQEVEKRRQQKELLFLKAQQKREELKRQEEIIEQKKGTLSKISIDVLEEVLLMALTYRTSFKTLALLFKTTEEDVRIAFETLEPYYQSLFFLDHETSMEDEINERASYIKAYNYWVKRNCLIKEIKKAVLAKDTELELEVREALRIHREEIDDTLVFNTIDKKIEELTPLERKRIVFYRLKYGISNNSAAEIFHRNRNSLIRWEHAEMEKNMIFSEKIELLNDFYYHKQNFDLKDSYTPSGRGK